MLSAFRPPFAGSTLPTFTTSPKPSHDDDPARPDVARLARDHVVDLDRDVVVADRHDLAADAVAEGQRALDGVDREHAVVLARR